MNRRRYLWLSGLAAALLVAPTIVRVMPRLLWNASASVPIGFYTVHAVERPAVGDLVAYTAPDELDRFMVERGYIAAGVPLLKHVAGLSGQTVCRHGRAIFVDGAALGNALHRDRRGRDLPVWHGCRRLADGEIFLMNAGVRDSLDGRYFGPLPRANLIGALRPLWTDRVGDGHFVWFVTAPRTAR